MNKLTELGALSALLPPTSIGRIETVQDASQAIEPHLREVAYQIPLLFLWIRLLKTANMELPDVGSPFQELVESVGLKPLDTATLEQLAKQFHIDFREVAENDQQLAGLIANSIAWHRIKGTPASIEAALELCGFKGIVIEEDGSGDLWATYQLGLDGVRSIDDIKRIVAICNEMQPARCRLWRIYTIGEFDFRPVIYSDLTGYSDGYYSDVSGLKNTGIEGQDADHDLVIMLGIKNQFLSEPFVTGDMHACARFTQHTGFIGEYRDTPKYSDCYYGELFVQDNSFVIAELSSFMLDREVNPQPKWAMIITTTSKAMGVWSEDDDQYSDINTTYGGGAADICDAAYWSDFNYSDGPIAQHILIDEFTLDNTAYITPEINHYAEVSNEGVIGITCAENEVQHQFDVGIDSLYVFESWAGGVELVFDDQRYSDDNYSQFAPALVDKLVERTPAGARIGEVRSFISEPYKPQEFCIGSTSTLSTQTPHIRQNNWYGEYGGGRRWLEYFGYLNITNKEK